LLEESEIRRIWDFLESQLSTDDVSVEEDHISHEEMMRKSFPMICKLCDDKYQYEMHARPEAEINEPVLITFLKPLGCGAFAIVVKVRAESPISDDFAVKLFRRDSWQSPERLNTHISKETEIIYTLSRQMKEVPRPCFGNVAHRFTFEETEYEGFFMELFEYPTLFDYVNVKLNAVDNDDFEQRKDILFSDEYVEYYKRCMEILMKMWSFGVIHGDLHVNNFLYDEITNEIKLVDFGTAVVAHRKQLVKFQQGIVADICRFTASFVLMVIFPKGIFDDNQLTLLQETILEFRPEIGIFHEGQMTSQPEILRIIESFCERHGISRLTQPSPNEIKMVSDLLGTQPDFGTTDQGKRIFRIIGTSRFSTTLMAHALPDKLSIVAIMMLFIILNLFWTHHQKEKRNTRILEPLLLL